MTDAQAESSRQPQFSPSTQGQQWEVRKAGAWSRSWVGGHGERWLKVPISVLCLEGSGAGHPPCPGAGGQLKQAPRAEHNPIRPYHIQLPCQLSLS